jgi:hypothetical protein
VVLRWPPAMFFSTSTCQASKKNFLSKAKHEAQAQLLLKLRGLFIETRRGLEALGIPGKSSLESSCSSRGLKLQSKWEKDSKFVQNCGLLLLGNFSIVNIRIIENLFLIYLLNFLLAF